MKSIFSRFFFQVRAQCGKVLQNAITIFTENQHFFRQINSFTKEATKELISRKIFERDRVL